MEFAENVHREALLRRRIKFVVEKASMARLFKKGANAQLQQELLRRLDPVAIARLHTQHDYDNWLRRLITDDCWRPYSRDDLDQVRWGHFAKLVNIVIYEIMSNRELFSEPDWQCIRFFLHVPLDSTVFSTVTKLDPKFPATWVLKGMTEEEYWAMQTAARKLAAERNIPPIWFDDAWSYDAELGSDT